jgi:hypothetical protein
MRLFTRLALLLSMLMISSAQAAEWNGKWAARGPGGGCGDNTGTEGDMLEFSAKEVLGYEWNADIKRVSKANGVYIFDLFTPESEMNGPAEKSKWLVVVAKDGKALMISTKGGKDWQLYDRCK